MKQDQEDPRAPEAHSILPPSEYVRQPSEKEVGFEKPDQKQAAGDPQKATGDLHGRIRPSAKAQCKWRPRPRPAHLRYRQ